MANTILKTLLPETMDIMSEQLDDDHKRWGDTWRNRSADGQDERIANRLQDYIDQYRNGGTPLPYAKIANLAHIALVRLNHPELLIE